MRTYQIEGVEYPSVTTILQVVNKPGLNYWKMNQAVKAALAQKKAEDDGIGEYTPQDAPKRELSKAIKRGTRVHEYAAEYANGDAGSPSDGYEEAVESYFLDYKPQPLLTEVTVFHPLYGFAGTADSVARIEDSTWLIDYKTSKRMYAEMHMQVSAYANAPYYFDGKMRRTMPFINKLGVVLFRESGEVAFKEVEDCFQAFLSALGLWRWIRRWGK